jgi:vancomycin resistance protein YoaR
MARRILLFAAIALCVFSLCGCREQKQYATIEEAVRDGAVLGEKIVVDGIDVSGLGVLEARRLLVDAQNERVAAISYIVRAGGESVMIPANDLGIRFNTDDVLAKAASLPQKTGFRNDETREFATSVSVSPMDVARAAQQAALSLYKEPVDAEVYFDVSSETYFSYREETLGIQVDDKDLALWLTQKALALDGGVTDAQASDIPADYTIEEAEYDTQLISEFTTSFKGSTYSKANRVFNIVKAASLLDGVAIEPDATFSINEILGPRNGENGWKVATGIKYGAYVQEYGGGVCQVSTTLYNAALMADLTITDRSHHSWPLGYVSIGRDATISTDGPDLCFVNNTGAPIFLRAFTNEKDKTVTVRIYGRPLADGVTIRVTSKKTGTLEDLGTEVLVDPALAPGEVNIVREARIGVTAETYKEYYAADGTLIRKELVSRDKYRSIQGLMYISAIVETPAPTPEETIPVDTGDPEWWN